MIFWEKGNVNLHGLKVSTDNPCILNLIEKNRELHLTVSDPSQTLDRIKIIISGNWNGGKLSSDASKTEITIVLPKEGMAGSTVKKTIKR
jgi:hypothetical protein